VTHVRHGQGVDAAVTVSTYFGLSRMLNLGNAVSIQMKVSRNSLSSNFHHLSGVYLEGAPSFRVLRPVRMYVGMLYSANITLNDSFGSHPPLTIGDGKPHETERAL
jgi:hypothetical protein